jgi:hypothetical protein
MVDVYKAVVLNYGRAKGTENGPPKYQTRKRKHNLNIYSLFP